MKFSELLGKKKQKTRQLWEREFNIVNQGLDEKQVVAFVDDLIAEHKAAQEASAASVRPVIQEAVADAKQVSAELKEYESAIPGAPIEAAPPVEKMGEPAPPLEAIAAEPAVATTEELLGQHLPEERLGTEAKSAPLQPDSQTPDTGEIEIDIAAPVDPKMVSKLYNHLQTVPEIKILSTTGSWDRGATITVVLEKPVSLIGVLSKIEGLKATIESSEKEGLVKQKTGSSLKTKKGVAKRIKLSLT